MQEMGRVAEELFEALEEMRGQLNALREHVHELQQALEGRGGERRQGRRGGAERRGPEARQQRRRAPSSRRRR